MRMLQFAYCVLWMPTQMLSSSYVNIADGAPPRTTSMNCRSWGFDLDVTKERNRNHKHI